ncbi:MAG TPA: hypothetical protein PK323_04045 [Bacteroidia bacterium]|nr:hypothetical protein [Bacteroidia bacterium]
MNELAGNSGVSWHGKITLLFTAFVLLMLKYIFPEHHLLSWDVFGYYLYLPAKFIYHDPYLIQQDWLNHIVAEYESTATLYQINQFPETGNWIIKYSMGMSFLFAPFFFIAHYLAPIFGYKQDGFSAIYGVVIEIGLFLFSIIGLNYLMKVLFHYFESKIAIISFLLIVFASNYVQLTIQYSLLTHVPLFAMYAMLIYYSIKWNQYFLWKHFFYITIISGVITLIRPNEIVCVLIPILWSINDAEIRYKKWTFIWSSIPKLSMGVCMFLMPFFIQMLYWKNGTGQWLYYSYQNPGEGFDFFAPYTYQFLFSFRKGWFVYTPIALIAVLSLYQVYLKQRSIFLGLIVPIILSVYIISSWSCWWYAGGSYSQRAILSVYPLLALSLGFGLQYLFSIFGNFTLIPFAFLMMLNLFQAWQFSRDILDHERMTFAYYKKIFFKTERPQNAEKLLLVNRSADENEGIPDLSNYDQKTLWDQTYKLAPIGKEYTFCDSIGNNDHSSIFMNETNEFVDGLKLKFNEVTQQDHFWIKVAIDFFIPENYLTEGPRIVALFNHGENGTYKYRNKYLMNNDLKKNAWNHMEYYYLSPEVRSLNDELFVYLWHPTKEKVYVDNFNITIYTPKKNESNY